MTIRYYLRNAARQRGFDVVRLRDGQSLGGHLLQLFDLYNIDLVLDVGARVGEYGDWLRRNGYVGEIWSFEPVSENFQQLRKASSADSGWRVFNVALGADEGRAEINVSQTSHFSSFYTASDETRQDEQFKGAQTVGREDVEVRTLDGLLRDNPDLQKRRVYLKLDTQGYDLQVLSGGSAFLRTVAALQTEVALQPLYIESPTFDESLQAVRDAGFLISGLFPVANRPDLSVVEMDCVAVQPALLRPRL